VKDSFSFLSIYSSHLDTFPIFWRISIHCKKVELSFPILTIAFYSIRVLRRSTSNFQDGPSLYSSSKHNFPIGNLRTVVDTNLHLQFGRRKFCIVFPLLHELCLLDETPKVKHSKYAVLIHPLLNNANSVKKQ
jgi:hypothetical protein